MIQGFIDEEGNFDRQGFQQSLQEGVIALAQETMNATEKENIVPEAVDAIPDAEQNCLDPEYEPEHESSSEETSPIEEAVSSLDMAIDILQEKIQSSTCSEEIQTLRMKISDCYNLISECQNYDGDFAASLKTLEDSLRELGQSSEEKVQR